MRTKKKNKRAKKTKQRDAGPPLANITSALDEVMGGRVGYCWVTRAVDALFTKDGRRNGVHARDLCSMARNRFQSLWERSADQEFPRSAFGCYVRGKKMFSLTYVPGCGYIISLPNEDVTKFSLHDKKLWDLLSEEEQADY